jgi:DNA polymerase III delta prime subunit
MLSAIPIGTSLGMVVIGPMDDTSLEASDALLKTFEEFDSRYVCPVLWAEDEGGVPATIRSRCLRVWCPADPGFSPETPFLKIAEGICDAAIRQRIASVIEHLAEQTGYETELVRASVEVLTRREDWPVEERIKLWGRLRDALGSHHGAERPLTPLAVLSAFLGV